MRGRTHCRLLFLGLALIAASGLSSIADAQGSKLRFGVGPLQPTPSETKKAYEPFFAYLAKELGRDFDLTATTDWAGISVALANKQVDLAWMGPWGYVLANDDSGARAIATAKYDGKPIYHAIVVCKPGMPATEADIIGFCRDRLAHFKAPKLVEFVNALPKTATGKIQKYLLRAAAR